MNLVLTGYKCSGKSTVGKILSEKLNKSYLDIDEYIESNTGLKIREIFEICGEEYFRLLEESAIREICKQNGVIISTGGGVTLLYRNVKRLQGSGVIVYLTVSQSEAIDRMTREIEKTNRKVDISHFKEVIGRELAVRTPYYESCYAIKIATDGKSPYDIVDELIQQLEERYGNIDDFFTIVK